eukprot:796153_1
MTDTIYKWIMCVFDNTDSYDMNAPVPLNISTEPIEDCDCEDNIETNIDTNPICRIETFTSPIIQSKSNMDFINSNLQNHTMITYGINIDKTVNKNKFASTNVNKYDLIIKMESNVNTLEQIDKCCKFESTKSEQHI